MSAAAVYLIPTPSRTGSSSIRTTSTAPPPYHGSARMALPPYDSHDAYLRPNTRNTPRMVFDYSSASSGDEQTLSPSRSAPWYSRTTNPNAHRLPAQQHSRPFSPPSPATSPEPERQTQSFAAGLLRRTKRGDNFSNTTSLHPLLGMKPPPVLFDVRFPDTRLQVSRQWADAPGLDAATTTRSTALRILFEDCPWTIDVRGAHGKPVTPADVFKALYQSLSQPLTNTEWSLADDTRRRAIIKANLKRRGGAKAVADVRRVDWLGKRTLFSCMRRCTSTGVMEKRWLTTDEYQGEVWLVEFATNQQ